MTRAGQGRAGPAPAAVLRGTLVLAGALGLLAAASSALDPPARRASGADDEGCLACHAGIEPMHPEALLSCTDCHGGDPAGRTKLEAHVAEPRAALVTDEAVPPRDSHLAWRRFRNPMDLRVAEETCGECHEDVVEHLLVSLHGTTAGHLSDGYYEMGLLEERGSRYGVFPVKDPPLEGGEVESLNQVPPFAEGGDPRALATHYTDLARKECMQCHLWSEGRAVRGRVGFDGDYRGAGCAACHVAYDFDGLSRSGDPKVAKSEPGHPRTHELSAAPTTDTCTSCHYGDASIGLAFRGLSQLPPGAPGGPTIAGTTDVLRNRAFYLDDPALCPPDVHHERGMHCIDCHTASDVMGDGRLHGQMEHAVEITCQSCHGTFTEASTLRTPRGTPLAHLRREGERVILTGKVDGAEHVVPQVVHVLDPERPEYDSKAARAMRVEHANLECYVCHAAWNVNFPGFHFTRNASLNQLDLLSGERTPGRVTTQEKVFATWKSFYAGRNERGAVAPYMTGFSTLGSFWDETGELVLDQELPVTAEGLSGVTMIHHQTHTNRPTARECVECHRSSSTWGLGSPNFHLARRFAFVADGRGIETVALDRREPTRSAPLSKFVLPEVTALALDVDPARGTARTLFAAEEGLGVHALDVTDPLHPRRLDFLATVDPRGLARSGDHLIVCDGEGGLVIVDVSDPGDLRRVGHLPTVDARAASVHWPWVHAADGAGGLLVVDLRSPDRPRVLSALDLNGESQLENRATRVATLFQYGRPVAVDGRPVERREPARHLCVVLDERTGPCVVDVTDPERPVQLSPRPREGSRSTRRPEDLNQDLALLSEVALADPSGAEPTDERDYLYLLEVRSAGRQRANVVLHDVSRPRHVLEAPVGRVGSGSRARALATADLYDPPFRRRILLAAGAEGVFLTDVTHPAEPQQVGAVSTLRDARVIVVESFPLDRMVDEAGRRLKDVSHEGSRWLERAEIDRVLAVPSEVLAGGELAPPPPVHAGPARVDFPLLDRDGSGFLEGKELADADRSVADRSGDGRISLAELARHLGLLGKEPEPEEEDGEERPDPYEQRLEPDPLRRALARVVDGLTPYAFDANLDDYLDEEELEELLFTALDLDGNGSLDRDEYARLPGAPRELRSPGPAGDAAWRSVTRRKEGLRRRSFEVAPEDRAALDVNGDGRVFLEKLRFEFQREHGLTWRTSEWVKTRPDVLPLPPLVDVDTLLAVFDADGDGRISRKESRSRDELFQRLDLDKNDVVDRNELEAAVRRLADQGTAVLPDDFTSRWDLDGSGVVEPEELPPGVRLAVEPWREGSRAR